MTVYVLMLDGGYDGDSLLGVYASEDEAEAAALKWTLEEAVSWVREEQGTYIHAVKVGAVAKDYLEEKMRG